MAVQAVADVITFLANPVVGLANGIVGVIGFWKWGEKGREIVQQGANAVDREVGAFGKEARDQIKECGNFARTIIDRVAESAEHGIGKYNEFILSFASQACTMLVIDKVFYPHQMKHCTALPPQENACNVATILTFIPFITACGMLTHLTIRWGLPTKHEAQRNVPLAVQRPTERSVPQTPDPKRDQISFETDESIRRTQEILKSME